MRVTNIEVTNVLGIAAASIRATRPAVLVAGKNGAGKSSIGEAIRQAFIGTPGRGVENKKDFGKLIHDGAEFGGVTIDFEGGYATIVLPKGERKIEGKIEGGDYMQACIEPRMFAGMGDKERRTTLFSLTGVRITPATVKDRLVARGVEMSKAERAMPLLAAGFDTAMTEAKAKARDAKAAWKTATGGETWGKDKGAKWEPPALDVPADEAAKNLAGANETAAALDAEIADVQRRIGEANAIENQRRENAAKRKELNEKIDRAGRFAEKLAIDEAELSKWEEKVAETKAKAGGAPNPKAPGEFLLRGLASVTQDFLALTCEFSDVEWPADLVNRASIQLAEFRKLHGEPVEQERDPEAVAILPEYEKALALMRSAVENGRRNLRESTVAAEALGALGTDPSNEDPELLKAKANELNGKRREAREAVEKYQAIIKKAERREQVAKDAADLHADVMAWDDIAQAFAPDGIQAEFLAEAMGQFNAKLADLSDLAQWPTVEIDSDMQIIVGGRPYVFRSESEQWRADAIIAAAIAHVSGLKFVMLDRFDVLDMQGRGEALFWIDDMIEEGIIESAIILGTLKAIPGQLPGNICAKWVEGGKVEAEAA